MAAPLANFSVERISYSDLSVKFIDRSLNNPTSWSWDFGSGSTSTTQNPEFTYTSPGKYPVKLVVSNSEGTSEKEFELIIDYDATVPISIEQLVKQELPTGVVFDYAYFTTRRLYWQYYLAPLLDPKIPDADILEETKWPTLANMLIAKLIVYDMIVKQAESSLLSAATSSSTTTTTTPNTRGPLKAIETGPTRVEFHNSSETIKQLFGTGGTEGSPFQIFTQSICMLASRLRVKLPICQALAQQSPPFIVVKGKKKFCNTVIWRPDGLH